MMMMTDGTPPVLVMTVMASYGRRDDDVVVTQALRTAWAAIASVAAY